MNESTKNKYFSCIYCLNPKIIYDPLLFPEELITKCFLNHEIKYNINDYISIRKEQIDILSKLKCDKCESHKNITYCSDEKIFLCGKCFQKNHKDKTHSLFDLNKVDSCPKHKKDFLFCKECEAIFCKFCDKETHEKHKFCAMKEFFLNEKEEQKTQLVINKLNQINNDLLYKIFNKVKNQFDYLDTIYKIRQSEIELYVLIKKDFNISKSKNFNQLFNIRNHLLNKFESINNLSYIDFIKETKVQEEKIKSRDSLIQYLISQKYINFDSLSYNDAQNISVLKDNLNNIYIDHFLLLKDNNILITSGSTCFLYNESMELKLQFKLGDINSNNLIISYIHYKKYNEINNEDIIYAFITGVIYEIILIKEDKGNYVYKIEEHKNKRISHKVDGVIDMKNGDVIVCCHMYPVICWRKDVNNDKKFYEYKVLTEQKPYIKNAINIIHLSDDEFVTTSNSWPSLKFYKYSEDNINEEYKIIKDIKMNCSKRKNTLSLWKNEIILVGLEYSNICLLSIKNKEIITTIAGIDALYIYVRNNNDIIINEIIDNYFLSTAMKIYGFEKGELSFKGVLKNKLQIRAKQILENDKGNLFISNFNTDSDEYSYIYLDKS